MAAPGKPIRLQRKATVGEEGLLLPENQRSHAVHDRQEGVVTPEKSGDVTEEKAV